MKKEYIMESNKEHSACNGCRYKCLKTHCKVHEISTFRVMNKSTLSSLDLPDSFIKDISCSGDTDVLFRGPNGQLWAVPVNFDRNRPHLRDGWVSFVAANSLQKGDIVILTYMSNSLFHVRIFSGDGNEKKYGASLVRVSNSVHSKIRDMPRNINSIYSTRTSVTSGPRRSDLENKQRVLKGQMFSVFMNRKVNNSVNAGGLPSYATRAKGCSSSKSLSARNQATMFNYGHSAGSGLLKPKREFDTPESPINTVKFPKKTLGSSRFNPIILDDEEETDDHSLPSSMHPSQGEHPYSDSEVIQERFPVSENKKTKLSRDGMVSIALKATAVASPFVLSLPKKFSDVWLPNERKELILICEHQEWNVVCNGDQKYTNLTSGWKSFVEDNGLKIGDVCIFDAKDVRRSHCMEVIISRSKC